MKSGYLTLIIICLNALLALVYFDVNIGEALLLAAVGSLILLPFTIIEALAILTIGSVLHYFIERYKVRNKHLKTI